MAGSNLLPDLDFETLLSSPPTLSSQPVQHRQDQVQSNNTTSSETAQTFRQHGAINPRSLLADHAPPRPAAWRRQLQHSSRAQFLEIQRQLESQKQRIESLENYKQEVSSLMSQVRDLQDLIRKEIQPWLQAMIPWLQTLKAQVVDIMAYINEDVAGAPIDTKLPELDPFP